MECSNSTMKNVFLRSQLKDNKKMQKNMINS